LSYRKNISDEELEYLRQQALLGDSEAIHRLAQEITVISLLEELRQGVIPGSDEDFAIISQIINVMIQERDLEIPRALYREYEIGLMARATFTTDREGRRKRSKQNGEIMLDILELRQKAYFYPPPVCLFFDTFEDYLDHEVSPPVSEHDRTRLIELYDWIENDWRGSQPGYGSGWHSFYNQTYSEEIQQTSQRMYQHMCNGFYTGADPQSHSQGSMYVGYHWLIALREFERLVFQAGKDYMKQHNIEQNIRNYFPKRTRIHIASFLLWECETKLGNRGFLWQELKNLPMRGQLGGKQVRFLIDQQGEKGRLLTRKEINELKWI
jgi:hypothetical protein